MTLSQITQLIKTVPDFPVTGIQFKDISPILQNPKAFSTTIDLLVQKLVDTDFDYIIGIDARGFIFGAALAYKLKMGFVMARKENKLPGTLLSQSFNYEYSQASLTLQQASIIPEKKYLIVDDVLATGNTVRAVAQMVNQAKGICSGVLVFIELKVLMGRQLLTATGVNEKDIFSLIEVA